MLARPLMQQCMYVWGRERLTPPSPPLSPKTRKSIDSYLDRAFSLWYLAFVQPRKGCFEVRNVETGEQYVSLLNMPRPFPPLKALDIDELAAEILGKLEGK
jgi:hypothetical protein